MPSAVMERGRHKLQNIMEDGLGKDLMNGRFCFSCEQIFANRRCLEEHVCSAASYICSCGTEFTEYRDMQEHSTTHEPGHQVLDHETIKKRRIEKRIEEEEQLKRLQKGEVVWKMPNLDSAPPSSLAVKPGLQVPFSSACIPQVPMQSSQFSQVPTMYPPVSKAPYLSNPISSATDLKNIFAGVGAPTVDLWTLYQPVVLLETVRKFNKKRSYTCGKCGQCFMTKPSLLSHHSSHVTDKVSGCIGCGLLLSSKKIVPRFHICNSPNNATKFRLITARPLSNKKLIQDDTDRSCKPSAGKPQATSPLLLKSLNLIAASKDSQAPQVISTVQMKNQSIRTYTQKDQRLHVTSSLQWKSRSAIASTAPISSKSHSTNPCAYFKSSSRLSATPSGQLSMPINSASGVLSKPTNTTSASNAFTCRVCHIPFETAQLLQRHKCIKAQEFMAQHVRGGKQQYKLKRVTPVASLNPVQMNGDSKLGVPSSGNIKKNQVMAIGLDKGQGTVPVKGKSEMDIDDDCYIVESGPDKSAEMIYQVTSSVPIKT